MGVPDVYPGGARSLYASIGGYLDTSMLELPLKQLVFPLNLRLSKTNKNRQAGDIHLAVQISSRY